MSFDSSGVANLRLDDHDGDGTVGDMTTILQDADLVLAHFPGDEGDTCEEEKRVEGERSNFGKCCTHLFQMCLCGSYQCGCWPSSSASRARHVQRAT